MVDTPDYLHMPDRTFLGTLLKPAVYEQRGVPNADGLQSDYIAAMADGLIRKEGKRPLLLSLLNPAAYEQVRQTARQEFRAMCDKHSIDILTADDHTVFLYAHGAQNYEMIETRTALRKKAHEFASDMNALFAGCGTNAALNVDYHPALFADDIMFQLVQWAGRKRIL